MADMKKLLHTFDEADEILNDKIERTNLSTIVASATASVENKKTVLIRGTGRNIEVLKVGGKTVQNGTPTPTNPVEVKGVGDKVENLFDYSKLTTGKRIVWTTGESYDDSTAFYSDFMPVTEGHYFSSVTVYAIGFDASKNYLGSFKSGSYTKQQGDKVKEFDVPSNVKFIKVLRFTGMGDSIGFDANSVVIKNDELVSVPYGKPKYKIPILTDGKSQNIYLNAPLFDGEIADLVGGKVEKKYGMVVFDGSENWTTGTTQGFTYFGLLKTGTAIANAKNNTVAYSDYQVGVSTNNIAENIYVNSGGYLILLTQKLGTTVDAFKTWLSTHNMTVVYELDSDATETFDGAVIPVSATETELTFNTEVTPASIETTTFGDYYSKIEVDKMMEDAVVGRRDFLSSTIKDFIEVYLMKSTYKQFVTTGNKTSVTDSPISGWATFRFEKINDTMWTIVATAFAGDVTYMGNYNAGTITLKQVSN